MELRHLRYFVAIGEEQHYGRAARNLRVAQTALSTQIQDLEGELGFKLFERLPRGVKLSAAGKLFLEDARRILREVSEAAVRMPRSPKPMEQSPKRARIDAITVSMSSSDAQAADAARCAAPRFSSCGS